MYANAALSGFTLPQNDASHTIFECYRNGSRVSSITSGELAEYSSELWSKHFSATSGDTTDPHLFNVEVTGGQTAKPVFVSLDLESPLGFATFLANASNQRKVFIPSTFNLSKVLKSIKTQASVDLVCDKAVFELEPPGPLAQEYKEMCSAVKNIVVAGEGSLGSSTVFPGAKSTLIDPLKL